jgi:hypothetical protein
MSAIQSGHAYKHISALAATTVIKSGPGTLVRVCINTKGASSNVLTLYDNASAASGTVIATIDTTANVGTITFECDFLLGLTVSLATGTAADVTISYF